MENPLIISAAPTGPAAVTNSRSRANWWAGRRWWPQAESAHHTPVPWWVHVLLLLVLLSIDGMLYYTIRLSPSIVPGLQIDAAWYVRNAVLDALTAALFYWNWQVLFPRTLSRNRVGAYLGAAAGAVVASALLHINASNLVYWLFTSQSPGLRAYTLGVFALLLVGGLVTMLASSGVRMALDYLQGQRRRRETERQYLLTELGMLKTQINPHFLFNTLNNIYSLTSRKSDRAPEAVLRLAESMRYLLYDSSADTVPLAQDLAHLRSFLDLQRLRLPVAEAETAIVLRTHGTVEAAFAVAPLLLLPLVENAFKHGDLAARPEAIRMELEIVGEELRFSVHNYVAPAPTTDLPAQPGGLGLLNLRRRLQLLYPGRHELNVRTLPGEYAVELVLLSPTP